MTVIPRFVVAAPSSGHGKTAVTIGLLAAFAARGLTTAGFKIGPDHVDAGYLGLATGRPGRNLDPRLVGTSRVAPLFAHGAAGCDIAVVEGTMGLYDGLSGRTDVESTAQVAGLLRAPVVLVVDVGAMGQSVAALVHGFRSYDELLWLGGVILTRVVSDRHEEILRDSLGEIGVPVLGVLRRRELATLPPRSQGTVPVVHRSVDAVRAIRRLGEVVIEAVDLDRVLGLARSAPKLAVEAWSPLEVVTPALLVPASATVRGSAPRAVAAPARPAGMVTAEIDPAPATRAIAAAPDGSRATPDAGTTSKQGTEGGSRSLPAGDGGARSSAAGGATSAVSSGGGSASAAADGGSGTENGTRQFQAATDGPAVADGTNPLPVTDQVALTDDDATGAIPTGATLTGATGLGPTGATATGLSATGATSTAPTSPAPGAAPTSPAPRSAPTSPAPGSAPTSPAPTGPAPTGPAPRGEVPEGTDVLVAEPAPVAHPSPLWPGSEHTGPALLPAEPSRPVAPIIAVAGGPVFGFSYAETVELLEAAGAEVVAVDPLRDEELPEGTRGLVFGGGFPESYVDELAANETLTAAVASLAYSGAPIAAESAGLLWLVDEFDGRQMAGVLHATARTTEMLVLGYRDATARASSPLVKLGARVIGHKHHRTQVAPRAGDNAAWSWKGGQPEGFVWRRVHASYLHVHWAGYPEMASRFVAAASE